MDPTSQRLLLGSSASGEKYWISRFGSTASDVTYGQLAVDSTGNVYINGSTSAIATTDFFTAKIDPNGSSLWQRTLTGSGSEIGYGCCLDSALNVYTAGYSDTSSISRGTISKYNNSGSLQWQYRLGGSSVGDFYFSIASDSSDNIYAAGQTYTPRTTASDLWLTKFNTAGSPLWHLTIYTPSYSGFANCVATDSSGNVYVSGQQFNITFSGYVGYIAKINTSGTLQWERQYLGSSSSDLATGVVVDSSNNVYVCGYSSTASYSVGVVTKYNSVGTRLWQRSLSSALGNVVLLSIALDDSGNIYACGYIPTASTSLAAFIVKYNSSGSLQWQRSFDGSGSQADVFGGIKTYKNSVIACGYSATSSVGSNDIFIVKVPLDGSLTGTYGPYTYSSTSLTEAAYSSLDLSVNYLTTSPSYTATATSFTDSAGTLTNSVINIP